MKRRVGHGQQQQDGAERQVAPAAGAQQHRDEDGCHQRQQQQVQHRIDGIGREHGRQPGGQPQPGKCGQQRAARRGQAGPGFARGEQETHDDGNGKAEQHLVRVPQHGRHGQLQGHLAQQHRDPQRYGQHAVGGCTQIEGTEAEPKQRPALGCWRGGRRGGREGWKGRRHGVNGVPDRCNRPGADKHRHLMHLKDKRPLKQYTAFIFRATHAAFRIHRLHLARADVLRAASAAPGHDQRAGRATRPVEGPPDEGGERPGAAGSDRDHERARRRLRLSKEPETIRIGDVVRASETDFRLVECFDPSHQRLHPDAQLPPEAPVRCGPAGLLQGVGRCDAGRHGRVRPAKGRSEAGWRRWAQAGGRHRRGRTPIQATLAKAAAPRG